MTRDIAGRFNSIYGNVFKIPEPYVAPIGARIMSLQDPKSKMSKSDKNAANYIALLDPSDIIRKKVARAVTDSGKEIIYDETKKPGIANLMTIYSVVTGESLSGVEETYKGKGYARFKKDLAERIVEFVTPIQSRYEDIIRDTEKLREILIHGAEKATRNAYATLERVRNSIGFVSR